MCQYIGHFLSYSDTITVLDKPGESEASHPLVLPGVLNVSVCDSVPVHSLEVGEGQLLLLVLQGQAGLST